MDGDFETLVGGVSHRNEWADETCKNNPIEKGTDAAMSGRLSDESLWLPIQCADGTDGILPEGEWGFLSAGRPTGAEHLLHRSESRGH